MNAKSHFAKSEAQHQAMSDTHNALADECEKEGLDGCAKAAPACAKVHGERAIHYKAMHDDAANKAAVDELNKGRNELQPTNVSAVTPTPPGVRMAPRAGQKSVIAKADIDPEFAALVKIDSRDGDE